jgi:hypothetical protein
LSRDTDIVRLVDWTRDGLRSVPTDRWISELESGGPLLHLVIALVSRQVTVGLGASFEEALRSMAVRIIEGFSPADQLDWRGLAKALDETQRDALPDGICSAMAAKGGDIAPYFFDAFGDLLAESQQATEYARLVPDIFEPIVRARNEAGLAWMNRFLAATPALLKSPRHRRRRKHLIDLVETSARELHEAGGESPELDRLAQTLGGS